MKHGEKAIVVKGNDLIQKTNFNLTATEQKIIAYAIAELEPQKNEIKWIEISAKEFATLCNVPLNHVYESFKEIETSLDNKSLWVEMEDRSFRFRWFSEAIYFKGEGKIKVLLNSQLQEHLINLKRNFTQYELINIVHLKSKYSIRLYEYFKSFQFMHEKELTLEELKSLLGVQNKYPNYNDFNRYVLGKAVDEINEMTDIQVTYQETRIGRGGKVGKINFKVMERPQQIHLTDEVRAKIRKLASERQLSMWE